MYKIVVKEKILKLLKKYFLEGFHLNRKKYGII